MTKYNDDLNNALDIACRVMRSVHRAFAYRKVSFKREREEQADRIKIMKYTSPDDCETLAVSVYDENETVPYRTVAFLINGLGERFLIVNDDVECVRELVQKTVALEWFDDCLEEIPDGFEVTLQY